VPLATPDVVPARPHRLARQPRHRPITLSCRFVFETRGVSRRGTLSRGRLEDDAVDAGGSLVDEHRLIRVAGMSNQPRLVRPRTIRRA
jgi:hypothetical protein